MGALAETGLARSWRRCRPSHHDDVRCPAAGLAQQGKCSSYCRYSQAFFFFKQPLVVLLLSARPPGRADPGPTASKSCPGTFRTSLFLLLLSDPQFFKPESRCGSSGSWCQWPPVTAAQLHWHVGVLELARLWHPCGISCVKPDICRRPQVVASAGSPGPFFSR